MPSIEFHVAASPTLRFASMLYFLVRSLEARADLSGDWRVIVTLGRDGDVTPGTPPFAWAEGRPVEFRRPSAEIVARYEREAENRGQPFWRYFGTVMTQYLHPYEADLVVFLDADTIVTRPFGDVLDRVSETGGIAAKPAWQPPGKIDPDALLADLGLAYSGPPMEYSGWGWSFTEPRHGPPYLNAGFQALSRAAAEAQARDMPAAFAEISALPRANRYVWQLVQMIAIVRHEIPWIALDERFNMGIGPAARPVLEGAEGEALWQLGEEMVADTRVIHYCTPTPLFDRDRTMADPQALDAFLRQERLPESEAMLRDAFAPFADEWREIFLPL